MTQTTLPIWAENIKKFRRHEGLNQTQFGLLFGVTQQAVARWEAGASEPPIAVVIWVVGAGGVLA